MSSPIIPTFPVRSKDTVAAFRCDGPFAVISIASHGNPPAALPDTQDRVATLLLVFDDIDGEMVFTNEGWKSLDEVGRARFTLFDRMIAGAVLDFVAPLAATIGTIVVQCEAGRSRSAGMAAALGRVFGAGNDAVFRDPHFHPNLRVYRAILDEAEVRGLLQALVRTESSSTVPFR